MPNSKQTQLVQNISRESKSSFYFSFLFLNKSQRHAIESVYSFCRISDDIVDSDHPAAEKKSNLDQWRQDLDKCLVNAPQGDLFTSLHSSIETYKIPNHYFHEIIDGMQMDLDKKRYETFKDLESYCYKVASVVGLISIEIFGANHDKSKEYAINLGKALQLTNIIRDVHVDAKIDRVYLPQEDLDKFAYSVDELKNSVYNKNYLNLMQHQFERAKQFYNQSQELIHPSDRKFLKVAQMMGAIYHKLLLMIHRNKFDVFSKNHRLSKFQKFNTALSFSLFNRTI